MVSRSRRVRDVPPAEQSTAVTDSEGVYRGRHPSDHPSDHPFLRSLSHWLRDLSVEAEIAYHRGALARLREQQREKLAALITAAFPPGELFSGLNIWQQPALRAACLEAEITTAKQLGVWLRSWCGAGLDRICRDEDGIVWAVSETDLQEPSCPPIEDDV